jgi:hypothetical protein
VQSMLVKPPILTDSMKVQNAGGNICALEEPLFGMAKCCAIMNAMRDIEMRHKSEIGYYGPKGPQRTMPFRVFIPVTDPVSFQHVVGPKGLDLNMKYNNQYRQQCDAVHAIVFHKFEDCFENNIRMYSRPEHGKRVRQSKTLLLFECALHC